MAENVETEVSDVPVTNNPSWLEEACDYVSDSKGIKIGSAIGGAAIGGIIGNFINKKISQTNHGKIGGILGVGIGAICMYKLAKNADKLPDVVENIKDTMSDLGTKALQLAPDIYEASQYASQQKAAGETVSLADRFKYIKDNISNTSGQTYTMSTDEPDV